MKPLLVVQMPAKQRCGLLSLLALSLLPCIAGVLRLYYIEVYYDSVDELCKYNFMSCTKVYRLNLEGNASTIWALMMLEMNLGVVCGCLFGIQPVLAVLFPRLFPSSYPSNNHLSPPICRQESRHPESQRSFQEYPLADLSGDTQSTPYKADTFESLWTPEGTGSNYASASSSGRKHGERLTPGVIAVHTEFTVQEEITPCQSPVSELDRQLHFMTGVESEDWTMDEVFLKD